MGQSLNGFQVLDGSAFDGIVQNFNFFLPFAPIQRGNINLEFILPSGEIFSIADDRRGALLSLYGSGMIDYKTGACRLTTKFDYAQVDNMDQPVEDGQSDPTNGRIHFTHTLAGGTSIIPGSVWITFTVGEGANQRTYMVNDDSLGHFSHPLIQSGFIDYATKTVDITFSVALVDPLIKPFSCKYCFPIDYVLPAGTVLQASYFFTQQSIYITEAGFRSKDGDLLNYATFPPLEFNSTAYHLEFLFLVKRPV